MDTYVSWRSSLCLSELMAKYLPKKRLWPLCWRNTQIPLSGYQCRPAQGPAVQAARAAGSTGCTGGLYLLCVQMPQGAGMGYQNYRDFFLDLSNKLFMHVCNSDGGV